MHAEVELCPGNSTAPAMPPTTASAPPTSTPAATAPPSVAVPYCTADIQPGTVWSNYDGTYMSVVNIVSPLARLSACLPMSQHCELRGPPGRCLSAACGNVCQARYTPMLSCTADASTKETSKPGTGNLARQKSAQRLDDELFCAVQYMVNYGSVDIPTPWTFSIMNPDYLEVFQTWNWESDSMNSTTGEASGYANQVPRSASACRALSIAAVSVAISFASSHTQPSSLHICEGLPK